MQWHVFSNQTMINYAVLHFCPSPKKHVYMPDELLLCSWRPTMSAEGASSERFRKPKTFCEEEELVEKAVPFSTKYKNKWALSVFGEWQFDRTFKYEKPSKEKITEVSSVLGPSRSATEVKISEEKDLSCLTSSDAQDVVSAGPLNSCSFANCSVKIKVQYLQ